MEKIDIDDGFNEDIPGNKKKLKFASQKELELNYESDSSVEDYQQAENDKKEEEGSDDDMFASDKEEENTPVKKKQKNPEVELMDMKEFEKQEGIGDYDDELQQREKTLTSEDDDEDDLQEQLDYYQNEEFDENLRLKVKKSQPKLEAFDLKQEATEGAFDIDGNFIRKNDGELSSDEEWGKEFKKTDISKARKAQLARDELMKSKSKMKLLVYHTTESLLGDLIELLEPSETPLEALQRLNPKKKRRQQKSTSDDKRRKEIIFKTTEICEELMNEKAITDVYELSREELMRLYKQETGDAYRPASRGVKRSRDDNDDEVNNDTNIDYGEKKWEFKWIGQNEVNGVYSDYEMNHWKNTYFNDNVEVRKVGETTFVPIGSVEFTDVNDLLT